jgi:GMP synthase (glutamine-hydrolysing)
MQANSPPPPFQSDAADNRDAGGGTVGFAARPLRFLVAESEPPEARAKRRASVGQSSGETFESTLQELAPSASCDRITPADSDADVPSADMIAGYDAVFLTGSPIHMYDDTPEVARELRFMQAVFASATPAFGSCAGLQVATVAAGGRVRPMAPRREAGLARRISPTEEGRRHPLLRGRPGAYDAPAIHTDEVAALPADALWLAANSTTAVQAAEIRHDGGIFWGVQYHPELSLEEIAAALRRQADDLIENGLAGSHREIGHHADLFEALGADPTRRDVAWRLGVDDQVTNREQRRTELRNFIDLLVRPTVSRRGRA